VVVAVGRDGGAVTTLVAAFFAEDVAGGVAREGAGVVVAADRDVDIVVGCGGTTRGVSTTFVVVVGTSRARAESTTSPALSARDPLSVATATRRGAPRARAASPGAGSEKIAVPPSASSTTLVPKSHRSRGPGGRCVGGGVRAAVAALSPDTEGRGVLSDRISLIACPLATRVYMSLRDCKV
jgi:hypothetical protein